MSVVIDKLVKKYGEQLAVNHASFEALPGKITGFLGPNGAGKSTTMKIANGYLQQTEGDVFIHGKSVKENPFFAKKHIGYLPEHNPLYKDMYVREFLGFIGSAYGMNRKALEQRVATVIDQVGLNPEKKKKIKHLSKGYRQRVGLAQAFLSNPDILILDEPTTGLDPNQLIEIRNLIKEISRDKTVILSTHIMQEVEAICDQVVIINQGEIVADQSLSSLKKTSGKDKLRVVFEGAVEIDLLKNVQGVEKVTRVAEGIYDVLPAASGVKNHILNLSATKNLPLLEIKNSGGSLEEIFHHLTQ